MAESLRAKLRSRAWFFVLVALLAIGTALPAQATNYTAWVTGYAMYNYIGANWPYEVIQGDFANHDPGLCPQDPAAYWTWWTWIQMADPPYVVQHDSNGDYLYRSWFRLNDTGDPTCSQGNYWADLYFGRWKPDSDPCFCEDVGQCYWGVYNVCADAINFGRELRTYDGP